MSDLKLDCTAAREGDFVDRYVAGRLSDAEAEAFEAHYFACESCWAEVQTALEVRAALESREGAGTRPQHPGRPGLRWIGWTAGLAAAAAAAFLFFNVGSDGGPGDPGASEDVFRGAGTALNVETRAAEGTLVAEWATVPDADIYVARIYTEDGRLLYEREVSTPRVEVETAVLMEQGSFTVVYWRIEALDSLRQPVARSSLVPISLPSP